MVINQTIHFNGVTGAQRAEMQEFGRQIMRETMNAIEQSALRGGRFARLPRR